MLINLGGVKCRANPNKISRNLADMRHTQDQILMTQSGLRTPLLPLVDAYCMAKMHSTIQNV